MTLIELGDQALWCCQSECFFNDGGDFVPVDGIAIRHVEINAHPVCEDTTCRRCWLKEAVGFGRGQILGYAWRSETPQGDSSVGAEVGVMQAAE